jgi:RNA polymerase sigma-70 factor (ECF subfamily)
VSNKGRWFSTTHWSVVLAAGSNEETESQDALSTLCQTYWRPVYSYIRSRGHDPDTARDLTQGFFASILETRGIATARQERGRFRHFLLASVKNFLAHERERAQALKRGGGQTHIHFDGDPEQSFLAPPEPAARGTPETIFEKRWALTLLDQTMLDLRAEMERSGNRERFERLRPFLVSDAQPPHAALARELGLTEAAVRVALHRMRQRFGAVLRERVAQTLDDTGKVEDELRYLIGLMGA